MTHASVRERGARPIERGLPFDPATLVVILIVVGVLLRAFIGGIYLPLSGFRIDVGDFNAWAQRLASGGPGSQVAALQAQVTRLRTSPVGFVHGL